MERSMHDTTTPDCAAFKAVLSAYVDDELTRVERIGADAHLVACGGCRDLVERAEQMDEELRQEFARRESDGDLGLIDAAAMEARVLGTIGRERRTLWLPRFAAAAAAVAAIAGAAIFFSSRGHEGSLAPARIGEFASAGGSRELPPVAPPREAMMRLASLDADDRQALYATSVLLDTARRTAFEDRGRREELVQTARYDELVDRLGEVLPKLPPEDRATVALARDATVRILEGAEDPEGWERLREDVEVQDLDREVDELSDR
jgi:anti-sigma factor RsiW